MTRDEFLSIIEEYSIKNMEYTKNYKLKNEYSEQLKDIIQVQYFDQFDTVALSYFFSNSVLNSFSDSCFTQNMWSFKYEDYDLEFIKMKIKEWVEILKKFD